MERAYDDKAGRHQPTGQVIAAVAVVITVRAFRRDRRRVYLPTQ